MPIASAARCKVFEAQQIDRIRIFRGGPIRAIEVLAAAILLVILTPLLLLLAGLLLACGQRPMFRQTRVGLRQAEFTILKFRTLGALEDGAAAAGRADILRRVRRRAYAPLSRLLRRTRLDELPQLVNIVRGDMAFIGPRPLIAADVEAMPAWRSRRFDVRPGLTGLAQVSGGQSLGTAEKLLLDLYYLDHRSPGLNLWILCRTCLVPFRGDLRRPVLPPPARPNAGWSYGEDDGVQTGPPSQWPG